MQRAKLVGDAEIKATAKRKAIEKGLDDGLQLNPPELALHYDDEWLEIARQLEEAHEGMVIVNPRNLRATSLLEVDRVWLADMSTWRDAVQFWIDYPKRPTGMK